MSAEPCRKKAYSSDLRWRIVYQCIAMHLPFEKIARNVNVATSTAHCIFKLFEESGCVDPHHRPDRDDLKSFDEHTELYIVGLILARPSMYLSEVCQEAYEVFHLRLSPSTICRLLQKRGITRKKIRQVALQRREALRGAFMAHCFLFKREMFVWVDKTGSDARNSLRKFGYALQGVTPTTHRLLSRGKRI